MQNRSEFQAKLIELINCYSGENESNTPDFILGKYLMSCLDNFNDIIRSRELWYGRQIDVPNFAGHSPSVDRRTEPTI